VQAGDSQINICMKTAKNGPRIEHKSEARKDTNNPPDVEIARHSIAVVWKTIDAFRYHHRQLLVTAYFHCLCNQSNDVIDPTVP